MLLKIDCLLQMKDCSHCS